MQIPWTVHIPQAMQQHGASRTSPAEGMEGTALEELKCQAARPNRAEDAASRTHTCRSTIMP